MRNRTGSRAGWTIAALTAVSALAGCAELQKIRVAPLGTANSSSYRSMLADFNPLAFQHRSSKLDLLQAPEDRGRRVFWYHY
jgi:hypothetical protein